MTDQISAAIQELIDLDQRTKEIARARAKAEYQIRSSMLKSQVEEIVVQEGKVKLQKKGGKRKKTEEVSALETAIAAEKAEMRQANAADIYEAEKELIQVQAKINALSNNEWISELHGKLKEAKKKTSNEENQVVDYRLAVKPTVTIKPLDEIEPDLAKELLEEGKALREVCGKAITRAGINTFLENYFMYKYGDMGLTDAWEAYREDHIKSVQGV